MLTKGEMEATLSLFYEYCVIPTLSNWSMRSLIRTSNCTFNDPCLSDELQRLVLFQLDAFIQWLFCFSSRDFGTLFSALLCLWLGVLDEHSYCLWVSPGLFCLFFCASLSVEEVFFSLDLFVDKAAYSDRNLRMTPQGLNTWNSLPACKERRYRTSTSLGNLVTCMTSQTSG